MDFHSFIVGQLFALAALGGVYAAISLRRLARISVQVTDLIRMTRR